MKSICIAATVSLALATTAMAQDAEKAAPSAVEVGQAVVAASVEAREPVGAATSFAADVGTVFFYTELVGDVDELEIQHVWLRDGQEVARVPLSMHGPRWRTWSSKRIPPDWAGDWTVQVVDADDHVLASVDFTVGS